MWETTCSYRGRSCDRNSHELGLQGPEGPAVCVWGILGSSELCVWGGWHYMAWEGRASASLLCCRSHLALQGDVAQGEGVEAAFSEPVSSSAKGTVSSGA